MPSNKQYRGERRNAAKAFGAMAREETGKRPAWPDRWRVFGQLAPHVFAPSLKFGKDFTKNQYKRLALHFKSGIKQVSQRGEVHYKG
jgi:hypothetical protein